MWCLLKHTKVFSLLLLMLLMSGPVQANTLEPVQGKGCYTYGDRETPLDAKMKAKALARRAAVESHHVWVESRTVIENMRLTLEVIKTESVGLLTQEKWSSLKESGREFCITLHALFDPEEVKETVGQRRRQELVKDSVTSEEWTFPSVLGLRAWLNKPEGATFFEGEDLIVSVQVEVDAYLKVDYYQADGTVVHLVPNMWSERKRVNKGKVYEFGGPGSRARFRVQRPYGDEFIKVMARTAPFPPVIQAEEWTSESRKYIGKVGEGIKEMKRQVQEMKTRGIQVLPRESSAVLSLSTMSKAARAHSDVLKGK